MSLMNTKKYYALILRYLGMSFITGAVAHGFFSGYRSLFTAIFGLVFFLSALFLEKESTSVTRYQIFWNTLLAIGVGIFTGGIQHFPDSPERSVWIVPLGFIIAAFSFSRSQMIHYTPRDTKWLTFTSLAVGVGSVVMFAVLESFSIIPHNH